MQEIINFIKSNVEKIGSKGVVVALSGGIDSAVVAELANRALSKRALIIAMPIEKMKGMKDAKDLALKHNYNFKIIDLTDSYKSLKKTLKITTKMAKANLKSRLRMITSYAIANEKNYLVLGTSNASELLIGYFTKYGDGASDLLPIGHLYKSEIYKLARKLDIPFSIINKPPSADLWEGQTDEKELGFKYEDIELYISDKIKNKNLENKIKSKILSNKHKLENAKKVS